MINIQISFGPTRSPNARQAQKLAGKFDDHSEGIIKTDPVEILSKWEIFTHLFHMIRGWASFQLYLNDQIISKKGYSNFFYSLQDIYYCHRSESYQVGYCDQFDWGCSLIKCMRLHPAKYEGGHFWYHFGHFKGLTWIIHKKEIKESILNEVSKKNIYTCPLFNFKRVEQIIDLLPDEIDMRKNKFFRITYRMKFVGSNILEVPESIEHISEAVYPVRRH